MLFPYDLRKCHIADDGGIKWMTFCKEVSMNAETCKRFFLCPNDTWHRRYEVLRAVFVEQHSMKEVASSSVQSS